MPKRIEISMEFYSLKAASEYAENLSNDPGFDSDKFEIEIHHTLTNPDIYEIVVLPALNLNKE